MTAEQGIEIFNTIKLQMNGIEQEKFQKMMLSQISDRQKNINQCLEKLLKKHAKGQNLKIKKLNN